VPHECKKIAIVFLCVGKVSYLNQVGHKARIAVQGLGQ